MPFSIDTDDVQFLVWPPEVLQAIDRMCADANGSAIGAMRAAKLFVQHFIQLDPDLDADELLPLKWMSWSALEQAGRSLERSGIESKNRMREYLGITLMRLKEWSKGSGRRKGNSFVYCSLCWRHAVEGQKFCFHHNPQHNEAAYRKARRMLLQAGSSHDKNVSIQANLRHWLMGQREKDRIEADKYWQSVLDGQMPIGNWLRKFRARVFEKIGGDQAAPNITISTILERLDGEDSGESSVQMKSARNQLHKHIEEYPDELYGLLRRAEVILAIEVFTTKTRPHGGARINAGRPAQNLKK